MADATPPRRRWFQFNVVTLLLLVLVVGLVVLIAKEQRENELLRAQLQRFDAKVSYIERSYEKVLEVRDVARDLASMFAREKVELELRADAQATLRKIFDEKERGWESAPVQAQRIIFQAQLDKLFEGIDLERAAAEKQSLPIEPSLAPEPATKP